MRRGSTHGTKNESIAALWLGAMMAGPSAGTFSSPSVRMRQRKCSTGLITALATV
jgi:hypothetical protein